MKNRYIPYGYKIEDGQYTVDITEAETVKMVFLLYAQGQSYKAIAEMLNEGTSPAYSADGWNKHHVKRILENSRYTGNAQYPAMLSVEQFAVARAAHDEKIAGWQYDGDPAHILWERISCGECGGRMLRIGGKLAAKGIVQLRCKNHDCGYSVDIAINTIHRAVVRLQNQAATTLDCAQQQGYEPSLNILRLESRINSAITRPDNPAEAVRLILEVIDARYGGIPAPSKPLYEIQNDDANRLSEPDWELFKEAVSHISLSRVGIGLKTITGKEFFMERDDECANSGAAPAGSDRHTR